MEKLKSLSLYQKGLLLFMAAMVLIFALLYALTTSKVGYAYEGKIFIPSQENGNTIYTAKLRGETCVFTVTADKVVTFSHGDTHFGPFTTKDDPSAISDQIDLPSTASLQGFIFYEDDTPLFRGSVWVSDVHRFYYDEKGKPSSIGYNIKSYDGNGFTYDAAGNLIDSLKPSIAVVMELMAEPPLTHNGQWFAYFTSTLLCLVNAISILFADKLFRYDLSFQIRNPEQAEPSDYELAKRYVGWAVLAVVALFLFIIGLH